MKKLFTVIFIFGFTAAIAQTKDEQELTEKTYLLSHTVFGTKDSMTLESLVAKTLSYGHSHGNLQTREEMIRGVSHNQSIYTDTAISNIKIIIEGKTAIVRYLFKARETKKDATATNLNFSMMLVWVKEKREWKLMGRQAVSVQ
jgi:hypothetical protein